MTQNEEMSMLAQRVYTHIVNQGQASMNDDRCEYLADDGSKCAAGIFITDYDSSMEGNLFKDLCELSINSSKIEPVAYKHSRFVTMLQSVHDSAAHDANDFIIRFKEYLIRWINNWNEKYGTDVKIPE